MTPGATTAGTASAADAREGFASPAAVSGILTPRVNHHARVPLSGMRGVLTMDMQLIVDLSRRQPGWQCQGTAISDLDQFESTSPIHAAFRDVARRGAAQFVADLARQGYSLLTQEGDLRIWGPYHSRNWKAQLNGRLKAEGRRADEVLWDDAVDFLIVGSFLQTRTILTELTPQKQRPLPAAEREAINAAMWPQQHRTRK